MGVRKFRAYLKYMKRALLPKFMIEIDGEQDEDFTENRPIDFLKDDVVGTPREATLWRRATLYNTFAKLQE